MIKTQMKNTKTTIFLIRHGMTYKGREVFWSRKPGRSLSFQGKDQIKNTTAYLSQYPISGIWYSPLKRTSQSATIIRSGFPDALFESTSELLEWDIGFHGQRLEGHPFSFFGKEIFHTYQHKPTSFEGGETLTQAVHRTTIFFRNIIQKFSGSYIACITHQDIIRSTVLFFQRKSLDLISTIPCDYASIYTLEFIHTNFISAAYYDPKVNVIMQSKH